MFISEHAMIIIFGGSIAATMIRFPLGVMLHGLPLGAKFAFTMSRLSARDLVDELARIAEIAASRDRSAWKRSIPRAVSRREFRYVADGYDSNSSATNGSLVSTFSRPTGPCCGRFSAMRASSSTGRAPRAGSS